MEVWGRGSPQQVVSNIEELKCGTKPLWKSQFYQKIRLIGNENNITCNFSNLNFFKLLSHSTTVVSQKPTNWFLFKQHCFIRVAAWLDDREGLFAASQSATSSNQFNSYSCLSDIQFYKPYLMRAYYLFSCLLCCVLK